MQYCFFSILWLHGFCSTRGVGCHGAFPGLQPVQQSVPRRLCAALLPELLTAYSCQLFSQCLPHGSEKKKKPLDPVSSTTLGENGNCYKGVFLSQARGLGVLDMGGPEPRPSSAYRVRTLTELQHGQLLWSICFSVLQLQWPNTCQITHL